MLGAVFGDIVGSAYEWNNVKSKDFPLETPQTRYTDDTVMTIAVAKWLMDDPYHTEEGLVKCMQELGRRHIDAGYGGRFKEWLLSDNPQPYNSWGNGSAMRVSPVGLYASTFTEARNLARITAQVTHNHPEGIRGAMAVADCVFLNRWRGYNKLKLDTVKRSLRNLIKNHYGYNLDNSLDEIRKDYKFDVSCQGSVPEAIIAFLESNTLEDCVRNAVSIGGDSDTIAAIACSIFAANRECWDVSLMEKLDKYLPDDLKTIMLRFEEIVFPTKPARNSCQITDRIFAGEYPTDVDDDRSMKSERDSYHAILVEKLGLNDASKLFSVVNPKPIKTEVATKDLCMTKPMGSHVIITLDYFVPKDIMEVVKLGRIPNSMDQHWFMYCDESTIRYYRSWSGLCVFIADYVAVEDGYTITELKAIRDSDEQNLNEDIKDAAHFLALLTDEYGGDSEHFWNVYFGQDGR